MLLFYLFLFFFKLMLNALVLLLLIWLLYNLQLISTHYVFCYNSGHCCFPLLFLFWWWKNISNVKVSSVYSQNNSKPGLLSVFYEYFQLWVSTNKCRRVTVKNVSWSSFYSLKGSWQMKKKPRGDHVTKTLEEYWNQSVKEPVE